MKQIVVSTRLDREKERPLVRAAAETSGISVCQFVRLAVLDAARKRLAEFTAEQ